MWKLNAEGKIIFDKLKSEYNSVVISDTMIEVIKKENPFVIFPESWGWARVK